jgi:predicted Fe-S protein YdhL (DUF1289 family)
VTTDSQGQAAVPADAVESPCVRICALDDRQICLGCGRSLDEIARWSRMTSDEKRAVCEVALARKGAR